MILNLALLTAFSTSLVSALPNPFVTLDLTTSNSTMIKFKHCMTCAHSITFLDGSLSSDRFLKQVTVPSGPSATASLLQVVGPKGEIFFQEDRNAEYSFASLNNTGSGLNSTYTIKPLGPALGPINGGIGGSKDLGFEITKIKAGGVFDLTLLVHKSFVFPGKKTVPVQNATTAGEADGVFQLLRYKIKA